MVVLRSASDQRRLQVPRDCCCGGVGGGAGVVDVGRGCAECGSKSEQPSIEALMTLLWATYVIDRERQRDEARNRKARAQQQEQENEERGDHSLFDAPLSSRKVFEHAARGISSMERKMEEKSSSSCRRSWASSASLERGGERWEK